MKLNSVLLPVCFLAAVFVYSCKGSVKDSDILTAINEKIQSVPEMSGLTASVSEGVVTLNGMCKDDACKTSCESAVKGLAGVKSVVNNCTVTPPVTETTVVPPVSDALTQAVTDACKDFPGLKTDLKDGVLTLTGEIEKDKLQTLMMGLNALKSMGLKKIESAELVKK